MAFRYRCRACNGPNLKKVIDFGKMPLANGFLAEEEFESEKFYPLEFGFCVDCSMAQLINPIAPSVLFTENYPFVSSSSGRMVNHFDELVDSAIHESPKSSPRLLEIGCNDGAALERARAKGAMVLGIEPSGTAKIAKEKGIGVLEATFASLLAKSIRQTQGLWDIIIATNTLCHVHDLDDVLFGIKMLLAEGGVFIFEDPYLPDILRLTAYDQIYDEHKWYFSVTSVNRLLTRHGLKLVMVEPQTVHGGSMRYWVINEGEKRDDSVRQAIEQEQFIDLERLYEFKRETIVEIRNLQDSLDESLKRGRKIAGYGATSKSTVILNALERWLPIQYITDTTPQKQGRFSPGVHIPIVSPDKLREDDIGVVLMLAWNHFDEIIEKDPIFNERSRKLLFHSRRVAEWVTR